MSTIKGIPGVNSNSITPLNRQSKADGSFGSTLNGFLKDVNGLINEAGQTVQKMATGEVTDIHEVIIAAEKASVGLEMVIEVRNKLMESYKEIMRMQI